MPTSAAQNYFPLLLQILIAMAVAGGMVGGSFFLGHKVRNRIKDMPYESGMVPTGDARGRFSVKFYLVGMLFILFDIEAIFLYPWVAVFRELKLAALLEMVLFIAFVLAGFFYIWKKGVLNWASEEHAEDKDAVRILSRDHHAA